MTEYIAWISFIGVSIVGFVLYLEVKDGHALRACYDKDVHDLRTKLVQLERKEADDIIKRTYRPIEERYATLGAVFEVRDRLDALAKAANYEWIPASTTPGRYGKIIQMPPAFAKFSEHYGKGVNHG